ncbi:MAG: NFACT family protein, partial [Defluviitaleaceae bacterium]|nr:NFACT family protein [Defluviitaleaceae bacterium]
MPLDGISINSLVRELSDALVGARVDKIYQPHADEVVLTLKKGSSLKLLLSASASSARVQLTETSRENPATPPLFCMVLRKHLLGGRIISVTQGIGFERVVNLDFTATNEMGDIVGLRLVAEIMGKHSNIILLNSSTEGAAIIDSIKRINHARSTVREVLPGRTYTPPPAQDKINTADILKDYSIFEDSLKDVSKSIKNALLNNFSGISSLLAGEIIFRSGLLPDLPVADLSSVDIKRLHGIFSDIVVSTLSDKNIFELVKDEAGTATDFAAYELTMFPSASRHAYLNFSVLIDDYYSTRDENLRISQKTRDLRQIVARCIERCVRKFDNFTKELEEIKDRDIWRIHGEILTANIYRITPGAASVTLENFYSENGGEIEITLNPKHSPAQNAQNYFKRYNKAKRAFDALGSQMERNQEELSYLESVYSALSTLD